MKGGLAKFLSLAILTITYLLRQTKCKQNGYINNLRVKDGNSLNFLKAKLNAEEASGYFSKYDRNLFSHLRKKKHTKGPNYMFLKSLQPINNKKKELNKTVKQNSKHSFRCNNYDAKDIVILEGLEAVRKRPGMYIGNTDSKGLHQILFEIVDNAVDEYNNHECNQIKVIIHNDESITIEDNGRGIPCDIHEKTKKSALETVLTVLHSGAKFLDDDTNMVVEEEKVKQKKTKKEVQETGNSNVSNNSKGADTSVDGTKENKDKNKTNESLQKYKYSSGLHGVGLSVSNALSTFMKVNVFRDNKIYNIELEKGKVVKELNVQDCPIKKRGTQIHYKPDNTIFKTNIKHNSEFIKNRLHQLAYLNDKLTFYFYDERNSNKSNSDKVSENGENNSYNKLDNYEYEIIKHEGGLDEYMEKLTKNKTNLFKVNNKVISISCFQKNIHVDLKLKWVTNQYNENILSFVNNVNTIDGGTHVDAMKYAISRSINYNVKKNESIKNFVNIPGEYIREGLTAILSIKMNNPEFEGQTKTKLGSYYLKPILESIIFEKLSEIFDFEPNLLNTIYLKALQAKKSDEEAKAARDLIRSKNNQYYSTILPGKLVDCISDDITKNEIFIVEGDSAAGSAKQARNREIQAILPLKGKILNVEKIKNNKKIFENVELKSLITAIGLSVNYDNSKTGKSTTNKRNDNKDIKKNNFIDNSLRYGKIIIMTDADVDGEHICILLLTFLYRFQKEIIENGNVYVACPPLYKVTYNKFYDNNIKDRVISKFNVTTKSSKYIIHTYSDSELNELLALLDMDKAQTLENKNNLKKRKKENFLNGQGKLNATNEDENNANFDQQNDQDNSEQSQTNSFISNDMSFSSSKKYEIQRFKGLGEMMADQLWSTTMDPQVRKLIRVTVSDAIKANNLINSLMGEDSKSRKDFIIKNSSSN
ncbi:DNA gyrase subunit B, putative [Plasmodium vinckei vinckei]|uniref:DNA topoisomerase 2 n=1 Tax=Plasmodium vinckei vinckei TaxID=54757 RepID=A0A449C0U9_PLAVN|nr:DNA gyrase subunit B, putative [Plasmodium vinckei vinckei]KEG03887.1 DNA gyrase subunit B [Plasmodium vinckei vinckei]VEV59317.1 DNA gyrase subunit B, putative [Plasmodium vinckei vinckei]